jgi:hypothetical protein
MPFCQLTTAVSSGENRHLFVIRGGSIAGGATITNGGPYSLVGQGATITADAAQAGLRVTGVDAYVRGVKILGTSASATIGIIADGGATIRLDGVEVTNMPQGGLRVTGGAGYDVQNSIFAGNGMMLDDAGRSIGGAFLATPAGAQPFRFAFNTVVKNREKGVTCGASSQIIEASLLAGQTDGVTPFPDSFGCMVATTSKALGAADPMLTSSYRITAGSPCVDFVAAPAAGAPDHDIDGNHRPQGGSFDCGASELVP